MISFLQCDELGYGERWIEPDSDDAPSTERPPPPSSPQQPERPPPPPRTPPVPPGGGIGGWINDRSSPWFEQGPCDD